MTNREKLRSMSDRKLGDWICGLMTAEDCEERCPARNLYHVGHNGMPHWLKAKAKEAEESGSI